MSEVDSHNPYAPPVAEVASAAAETGLRRRSLWLMLLLLIVTFGIYYVVWFFRRRGGLNRLDSPRKLALWPLLLFAIYIGLSFLGGLLTGDENLKGHWGPEVALIITLLELALSILMIVQCFKIKDIIEDHAQGPDDAAGDVMFRPHVKLSGLMTFFFSIFYLQHAINKYVVDVRPI